jgi:hypothetical protein
MTEPLQRYHAVSVWAKPYEDPEGEYVKAADALAREQALRAELDEWKAQHMADASGHMFRCAKVNGVWQCATGCAMATVQALREEIAAVKAVERRQFIWAEEYMAKNRVLELEKEALQGQLTVLQKALREIRRCSGNHLVDDLVDEALRGLHV